MPQIPLWRDALTTDDVLAAFTPDDDGLTRAQIAERLGISKRRSLINLIEGLVEAGALRRTEDRLLNGAMVFVYEKT